jgi:methylmalonyl-CoA/ethylmalonyl-CoA epimerase
MKKCYLTPHHVGISVANLEESIAWYAKYLDFELLWSKDFAPIQTKIAFLQHGNFKIELFEHYKTKKIAAYRKFPLKDIQYQGTKHICFVMDIGIETLYEQLVADGADIAMSLRLSPPKDAMMCFIRDNTGNLIELIQLRMP